MALPDNELQALRLRCQQAMAAGFGLGKGDAYLAALSAELGKKPPAGKATPAMVLDALDQVIAARLGKPLNAKALEPEEEEPEEEEAEEETEEEEDETPTPKSAPSKPKPAPKSKPKAAKPKPKKR